MSSEHQEKVSNEILTLSQELLRLHDDLNNMLSKQEFFGIAISALIDGEDVEMLYTERQRTGMMRVAHEIRESGDEISNRLGVIRKQVGAYLG
ncbi:MAG: hypothetical protein COB36_11195 [Alphaproteobacteria bacterium]|nr:MAG: hypothetical protein COB36_11195 [Alphaproteobacteria bacterium]